MFGRKWFEWPRGGDLGGGAAYRRIYTLKIDYETVGNVCILHSAGQFGR